MKAMVACLGVMILIVVGIALAAFKPWDRSAKDNSVISLKGPFRCMSVAELVREASRAKAAGPLAEKQLSTKYVGRKLACTGWLKKVDLVDRYGMLFATPEADQLRDDYVFASFDAAEEPPLHAVDKQVTIGGVVARTGPLSFMLEQCHLFPDLPPDAAVPKLPGEESRAVLEPEHRPEQICGQVRRITTRCYYRVDFADGRSKVFNNVPAHPIEPGGSYVIFYDGDHFIKALRNLKEMDHEDSIPGAMSP